MENKLLLLLSEEGCEVSQEAIKCIRFGVDSINPYIPDSKTKIEDLIQELGDLQLIVELLEIDPNKIIDAKKYKIQKVLNGPMLDLKEILLAKGYDK